MPLITQATRLRHDGRRLTIRQWSLEVGINPRRICRRIQAGWSAERALTEPVGHRRLGRHPVPWTPPYDDPGWTRMATVELPGLLIAWDRHQRTVQVSGTLEEQTTYVPDRRGRGA